MTTQLPGRTGERAAGILLAVGTESGRAVTAFAVGGKPAAQFSATKTGEATVPQFDEVTQEAKEAAQAMQHCACAQKVELVATMQGQLGAINRDLDQLAAKVGNASDAAKAEEAKAKGA